MGLFIPPKLRALLDIDWTTLGVGKFLANTSSNGKAFSFQAAGGSLVAYDAQRMSDTSLQHYYKCLENSSATSLSDAVGSTALTLNGTVIAGHPPLFNDGSKSVRNYPNGTGNYIDLPASIFPAHNHAMTIDFWCNLLSVENGKYGQTFLFSADTNGVLDIAHGDSGGSFPDPCGSRFRRNNQNFNDVSGAAYIGGGCASLLGLHYIAITYDGSSVLKLYVDGKQCVQQSGIALNAFSGDGSIFGSSNGNYDCYGFASKIAVSNTALSAATLFTNYKTALGIT